MRRDSRHDHDESISPEPGVGPASKLGLNQQYAVVPVANSRKRVDIRVRDVLALVLIDEGNYLFSLWLVMDDHNREVFILSLQLGLEGVHPLLVTFARMNYWVDDRAGVMHHFVLALELQYGGCTDA